MRPRKTLVERFSAFAQFQADQFRTWLMDGRLRRSMANQQGISFDSQIEDDYWTLHWYRTWQQNPDGLARDHLTAYVQELTYWAALKTHNHFGNSQYGLADLFQIAIARFEQVLQGFNPHQGTNFKGYATIMTANLLRESLRQQQAIDICTDWGLLRKLSQKRLTAALAQAGLAPATIEQYVLAWRCFKTLYVPNQKSGSRRLPKPDEATWQAMTELYNRDRTLQLTTSSPTTATELATWLTACAKAARQYLYPAVVSIDAPTQTGTGDYSDNLTDDEQREGMAQLVHLEEVNQRQSQRQQMNTVLQAALQALEPEAQQLLQLYYQKELTQQAIAKELGLKQYQVSRRLTRMREQLLKPVLQWAEEILHSSPTPDVINNTSVALDDWLVHHYHQPSETAALAQPETSDKG
jgi:RNA polymerase sigma factor (sigma-70 family)